MAIVNDIFSPEEEEQDPFVSFLQTERIREEEEIEEPVVQPDINAPISGPPEDIDANILEDVPENIISPTEEVIEEPPVEPTPTPTFLTDEEDRFGITDFISDTLLATIGGVFAEIRDIVVNVDKLTGAALDALGVVNDEEKDGILGLVSIIPDIPDPESTVGKMARGLIEFGTGFLLFGAAGRTVGIGSKVLLGAVASGAEAGLGKAEDEQRLADIVSQLAPSTVDTPLFGGIVSFLQSDPEDSAAENAFKNVVEDVLLGVGFLGAGKLATEFVDGIKQGGIASYLRNERGSIRLPNTAGDITGVQRAIEEINIQTGQVSAIVPESSDEVMNKILQSREPIFEAAIKEIDERIATTATPKTMEEILDVAKTGQFDEAMVRNIVGFEGDTAKNFVAVAKYTLDKGEEFAKSIEDAFDKAGTGGAAAISDTEKVDIYRKLAELTSGYDAFKQGRTQRGQALRFVREVEKAAGDRDLTALDTLYDTIAKLRNGELSMTEDEFLKIASQDAMKVSQSLANAAVNKVSVSDYIAELSYSGMLSSPATLVRVGIGTPLLFAYETGEKFFGGLLRGNKELIGEAARDLGSFVSGIADGFRIMRKAILTEEQDQILIGGLPTQTSVTIAPGKEAIRAFTGSSFGADPASNIGRALSIFGQVIRTPGRAIGAIDLGYQQMISRVVQNREAHRAALVDATSKNLTGQAFRDHVSQIAAQKLANPTEEILKQGVSEARRLSLASDLEGKIFGNFERFLNTQDPIVKTLLPFFRTSANAINLSLEKLPLTGLLMQRNRQIFRSGDTLARAQLVGSQALGASTMGMAAYMAAQGYLTGKAPANPAMREAWEASGRREYSVNIPNPGGDGVTSISYRYFGEPISFLFGMVADLKQGYDQIVEKADVEDPSLKDDLSAALAATGFAFAENITKKSFLKNVGDLVDLMSNPEQNVSKILARQLTTPIPLGNLARSIEKGFITKEMAETRTFIDNLVKNIPFYNADLKPKRNMFGEPVLFTPGFGNVLFPDFAFGLPADALDLFSPVSVKSVSDSDPSVVIANSIRENRISPEGMRVPKTIQGVKLTDDQIDLMETTRGSIILNGMTLKEALFDLVMNDPDYADMPGGDGGGKEALMSALVRKYTKAARAFLLEDFPEIGDEIEKKNTLRFGF